MNPMQPPVQTYQPKVPISVCVIAKNERKNLPRFHRAITKILGHPEDELILVDTGSSDTTAKMAESYGWKVIDASHLCCLNVEELGKKYFPESLDWEEFTAHGHYKDGLLRSFAEARQLGYNAAKNRYQFWLDLDDTIVGAETFREFVDRIFEDGKPGAIMMAYEYAHAEDGKCTTELWRERVTSKGDFEWKGKCHETLIPKKGRDGLALVRATDWPCKIYHATPKTHKFSDVRNYLILRSDLDTNEYRDPRTLFYLGNAARGLGLCAEAIRWYTEFVGMSGNREDVLAAFLTMAGCFNELGRSYKAVQACEEAMRVAPEDARVYYFMADAWFRLGHWPNVLHMVRLGDACPSRDTLHAVDPNTLGFHPAAIAAAAARQLRNPELTMEFANRALQERPQWREAQQAYEDTARWAGATKMGVVIGDVLAHCKDPHEARKHMPLSPHLQQYGIGVPEKPFDVPEGKKTVAFYCGHTGEPWGPKTHETGMGASEKMVYDLARQLAKDEKYHVSVYCSLPPGDDGEVDGVHWKHSATYDPDIYRDYLVIWRVPQVLETRAYRAGKIFVWMHDVGNNGWWKPELLEQIDKVFFLSKFQRGLHPAVPEEKVYYTRNGVDLERHLYDGTPKKKKIVYMSSPDRGWLRAIKAFRDSGLERDGFELHMFYGFSQNWREYAAQVGFAHVVELEKDMSLFQYEDMCYDACDGKTVINRGRVGWEEIAKELKEAAIWLYPTNFDEISCVSAMEAMAAGCLCVSTDYAALAETLKGYTGWYKLPQKETDKAKWCDVLYKAARSRSWTSDCCEQRAQFSRKFDISALAVRWAAELFTEETDAEPAPAGFSLDVENGTLGKDDGQPVGSQKCARRPCAGLKKAIRSKGGGSTKSPRQCKE